MMKTELYQVDSFTTEPFKGNPAGVCLLEQPASESWMQNLAMEMNLAETAFIYPESDGFRLRWFTPITEVELCGHATLATAHILFETGKLKPNETARFYTKSGILTVKKNDDFLEMIFPATPASQCPEPENLSRALGNVNFLYCGKNDFDYLVELDSEDVIKSLKPDFELLKQITTRGIIVTSRSRSLEFDFVSRFFAPSLGIDEDPVTGSAHCTLGPYWVKKLSKSKFVAYQASSRGGIVQVELKGDRVLLRGRAVTIFSASLTDKVRNK